ncbi:methyltransferase domain-containing protein [Tundrisphaera lichenicola]|uniref:methyltransferase domain-containing protein n=1 Tax=Tundrisphaera lichenicola TaxID=2029860 RepID=UPI003EB9AC8B
MTTATNAESGTYDNKGQYTRTGILRYEKVFGHGYVSTGGHETTEYLCSKLGDSLRPGARVLDVGSGIGGAAFHLAKKYGAVVTGVDLSPEMINIALDRAREADAPPTVTSILGDVLTYPFEDKFDIIWSRDALMHLPDKPGLFSRLYDLTAPGGQLVITDYAKGVGDRSPEFRSYIEKTGYHVVDPASYGKLLEGAGYVDVEVEDATDRFVEILERELALLASNRQDFLNSFSEEDLNYLVDRWKMKVGFCQAGDMKWGIYRAARKA